MSAAAWKAHANARDLGGLPAAGRKVTRSERLLRSGEFDHLDANSLAALLPLEPSAIIDLRSAAGVHHRRHPFSHHPGYRTVPFIDPDRDRERDPEFERNRFDLYRGSVDRNGRQIAAAARAIADAEDGLVIVHCRSGVDRTGILVAVILDALDVDQLAIAQDYVREPSAHPGAGAASGVLAEPLAMSTMQRLLRHVARTYGGSKRYLGHHGLSDQSIKRLHERLIQAAPPEST